MLQKIKALSKGKKLVITIGLLLLIPFAYHVTQPAAYQPDLEKISTASVLGDQTASSSATDVNDGTSTPNALGGTASTAASSASSTASITQPASPSSAHAGTEAAAGSTVTATPSPSAVTTPTAPYPYTPSPGSPPNSLPPTTYTPPAGTSSNCDANYTGACVPNVYPADVDCQGGDGNGPYYVQGPLHVVGTDIYKLDRDGDGIACN